MSNKPLMMPKKDFQKLSMGTRRRLMGLGYKTELDNYEVKGILLGQLGKNYSETAVQAKAITGAELLGLAYQKIREAYLIIGGRILFLECEDHPKLKKFYTANGFVELLDFQSPTGLCVFYKDLKNV